MRKITYCPILLKEGHSAYNTKAEYELFSQNKVSPYLDFAVEDEDDLEKISKNLEYLSISGVQEKYAAIIDNKKIRLSQNGEQSTHILKPAPIDKISFRKQIPANEHLTMQIAKQVYGIETALNGLCFSSDNQLVYITRRYDILQDGTKIKQEDFCSLIGRNEQIGGLDFKYNGSYEDMANIIKKYIPAWPIALERFFRLVIFNYIYGNGDAHLKNFSVLYQNEDIQLAPAYDLINTEVHIHSSDFGMKDGLSQTLSKSDIYERTEHPCEEDFRNFGALIGLMPKRIDTIINQFREFPDKVKELIQNSYFFDDSIKRKYWKIIEERRMRFIRK